MIDKKRNEAKSGISLGMEGNVFGKPLECIGHRSVGFKDLK